MPGGVSNEQLMSFYTTLSIALNAGAPLMQCLTAFREQNQNPKFDKILEGITTDVSSGKPFSEAVARYPNVFPNDFISLIAAGEMSGQMDKLLKEYVEFAEGQAKLESKFKGAMMYPAVMALIAVGVTVMLTTVIFPKFITSLNLKPENMPGITLFVQNLSNFLMTQWHLIIVTLIAVGSGLYYAITKTDKGAEIFDMVCFNSPVLGDLLKKFYVSRLVHTLASQLRGGVPGLQALGICKQSISNRQFKILIEDTIDALKGGGTYSDGLKKHRKVIPPIVLLMFSIGEETGSMEVVLEKIGKYYDEQVGQAVGTLIGLIEPLMIVVMGTIVTTLALSMFLPMFDMGKNMG
ncbi:MAG: type II secretion system F family protein [Candidatus Cloacimonetes bacterium]|nr:type II secretion system F family protein [Candidatus Cloacimonadota bacterium]